MSQAASTTRLPDVLLIGAMKAGTTSLYMDLARHPHFYLAEEKEPHSLCYDKVLSPAGRAEYAALYAGARAGELICDASTGYTKRPDYEGVPQRALQVLPAEFRVIYMTRDPIKRAISQYQHELVAGLVSHDVDRELRSTGRLVEFSRYSYQLAPWLEALGPERIRVVQLEDYNRHRDATLAQLCEFLGLDPALLPTGEAEKFNQTAGKPVRNRFWSKVYHSTLYRRYLRPLIPLQLRLSAFRVLLPKAASEFPEPTAETMAWLHEQLAGEEDRLRDLLAQAQSAVPVGSQ